LELPLELKRRVAGFLAARDAVNMTKSCRALRRNLALTHLEPVRPVFSTYRRYGDERNGDNWCRAFRIPVLNRRVHSMRMELLWRDQGFGNRKSRVRVVSYPIASSEIPDEVPPGDTASQGGHIVCQSGIAEHEEERLRLTFNPIEGDCYHLYYKVGGGGGHVLNMRDCVLHTVIFDDEHMNFSNNYRILFEEGVLCRQVIGGNQSGNQETTTSLFFPRMLINVSRVLRRQLLQDEIEMIADVPRSVPEDELEAFLTEYTIPLNLGSLVALEEIVQADIEERLIQRTERQREEAQRNEEERTPTLQIPFFPGREPFVVVDGVNHGMIQQAIDDIRANAFPADQPESDNDEDDMSV